MLFKMIDEKNQMKCCTPQSNDCIEPCEEARVEEKLMIDFLYLDLDVCDRCQGTDRSLDLALEDVAGVLALTGVKVELNKTKITSAELARTHQFESSPTIRINGRDIQLAVVEDQCVSCGTLCGDEVDCRLWYYKGKTYTEPPRPMIVEAMLKAVYGKEPTRAVEKDYVLPENLKRFFEGKKRIDEG